MDSGTALTHCLLGDANLFPYFFHGATIWGSARGRASRRAADAVNVVAALFHHGFFGTLLADRHCSPHVTAPRGNEASNQITSDSAFHNKSMRVAQR